MNTQSPRKLLPHFREILEKGMGMHRKEQWEQMRIRLQQSSQDVIWA